MELPTFVETMVGRRKGSQKDDVAVGARCNVLLQKATLAFCGGGGVVSVPPPDVNFAVTVKKRIRKLQIV
jgi:hypothetical protein